MLEPLRCVLITHALLLLFLLPFRLVVCSFSFIPARVITNLSLRSACRPLRFSCLCVQLHAMIPSLSLIFSQTGKFLAAGINDGTVCIYDVEEASWDHRTLPGRGHSSAIVALSWSRCALGPDPVLDFLRIRTASMRPVLLELPPEGVPYTYPPMEGGGGGVLPPLALERDSGELAQCVCAGDATGLLSFTVGAALPLGVVPPRPGPPRPVTAIALAADWSLALILSAMPTRTHSTLTLLDTLPLAVNARDLHLVRALACACGELIGKCSVLVGVSIREFAGAEAASPVMFVCVVVCAVCVYVCVYPRTSCMTCTPQGCSLPPPSSSSKPASMNPQSLNFTALLKLRAALWRPWCAITIGECVCVCARVRSCAWTCVCVRGICFKVYLYVKPRCLGIAHLFPHTRVRVCVDCHETPLVSDVTCPSPCVSLLLVCMPLLLPPQCVHHVMPGAEKVLLGLSCLRGSVGLDLGILGWTDDDFTALIADMTQLLVTVWPSPPPDECVGVTVGVECRCSGVAVC